MKKEIEMKNDGRDLERFEQLLKTVVNIPKKELDAKKKEYQAKKAERKKD